jgi:hypothetical protein
MRTKIYNFEDILVFSEDVAQSLKIVRMLPEVSIESVTKAFANDLSYELLMGFLAAKEFHASEDKSEERAEQLFTRFAICLNTIQSCGIDPKSKPSELPEEEADRVAGIMKQMSQRPSTAQQPIGEKKPVETSAARHPGKVAFDDPWG